MKYKVDHLSDTHIQIHQSWRINHWCDYFNLRAEELKEIVKKIGPDVKHIQDYLALKKFKRRD